MGNLCFGKDDSKWAVSTSQSNKHLDYTVLNTVPTSLPKNRNLFENVYEIENRRLGSGNYGEVKKCTHKETGVVRAVKILNKERLGSTNLHDNWFLKQIQVLNFINHPSFIKIHEFFEDRDHFFLIMDYYKGGDLLQKIKSCRKLPEDLLKKIMKQLLIGVSYLHNLRIVHRDLKLENILFKEKNGDVLVKIIDFDTSVKLTDKGVISGLYGTIYYMAPELINLEYNEKCDIWSLGIIMYALSTGELPYTGLSDHHILANIQKIPINLNSNFLQPLSDDAIDLLRKCLSKNPKTRISAEEALDHPWIKSESFNSAKNKITIENFDVNSIKTPAVKDFLVSNFTIVKDYTMLDLAFLELDADYDGIVMWDDVFEFFKKFYDETTAENKADSLICKIQGCHDDRFTYSEFLNAGIDLRSILNEKRILKFMMTRNKEKRNNGINEDFFGKSVRSIKVDNEVEEWMQELGNRVDEDITPKDLQDAMLDKLYLNSSDNNASGIFDERVLERSMRETNIFDYEKHHKRYGAKDFEVSAYEKINMKREQV
ncbi:hypothetical protein SteCoe_1685 [Stentor coeruleus]|uniref:non-specific serine/threonine protein kinase n=1 Tax=Stentor coeruleus TaxID=5963 RepID=A0A1R2D171_9CILI|nr:hypothetical protein SteCoe_1685 [Stentor coeruleus]